jgi:hypothetical protein
MRLGDLDALKKEVSNLMGYIGSGMSPTMLIRNEVLNLIDNAPTVEPETRLVANVTFDKEQMEELVEKAKADILAQIERPQGEFNLEDFKQFVEGKIDMQDLYLPEHLFMLLDEYLDMKGGAENEC